MTGPLIPMGVIPQSWDNVFAVLLGMGFGFVLEGSGFSSSRKIIGTFFGYDFVVLKVFFTAAITAMIGLLYLSQIGWLDYSWLYIHPTYLASAIIGGIVMGLGFAMGGFCPGTSFCGAAIGKIDAMVFIVGLFIGVYGFAFTYPWWEKMYMAKYLGEPKVSEKLGMSDGLFGLLLIVAALGMFIVAEWAEKKWPREEY